MLRHYYGESDIAHGACASLDYLRPNPSLGIYESAFPDASAGLSPIGGI